MYKKDIFHHESVVTLEQVARAVVDAPSLEGFKVGVDRILDNLTSLKMSLLTAEGGVVLDDF